MGRETSTSQFDNDPLLKLKSKKLNANEKMVSKKDNDKAQQDTCKGKNATKNDRC